MGLCAICLGCIAGTEGKLQPGMLETVRFCHHSRISELRSSARKGCPICGAAWEKVSVLCNSREGLLELLDQGDSFLECSILKSDRFTIFLYYSKAIGDVLELNPGQGSHLCHSVEFLPSESFVKASFGQPTSLSTWSDEAWRLVSGCIEDCVSKHTTCNEVESIDWRPTRLLDVAPLSSNPDRVRIILTDVDDCSGPYVTLSHCWGKVDFLKLLKGNMAELRAGFSTDVLPRNFREAVMVARRLEVRYLWIDSLCIVQDDKADWLREAVLMSKVYINAFCNIAATASADSTGGLFRERVPTELHRQEYDLYFAAGTDEGLEENSEDTSEKNYGLFPKAYYWFQALWGGTVKKDEMVKRFTLLQGAYWLDELDKAPLNCRGWVMQERLLSRRISHFTRKELVWECREHTACESHPHGFPTQVKTHSSFKTSRFTQPTGKDPNDPLSRGLWQDFQNAYCNCKLSVPSDRLIAISGVARKLQALNGDEYVAGMWLKTLAREILWNTVGHRRRRDAKPTSTTTYDNSFPSFSWASTSLQTRSSCPEMANLESLLRVSDVQIRSQHDALSGIIDSGSLHLHGRLKAAWLRYQEVSDSNLYHWAMFVSPTTEVEDAIKVTNNVFLDHPDLAVQTFSKQQPIYFMPGNRIGDMLCDCLLLQQVDGTKATFRRIGLARAFMMQGELGRLITGQPDEDLLPFDQLIAAQHDENKLPCLSYSSDSEFPHEVLIV